MREFKLAGSEGVLLLRGSDPRKSQPYDSWKYEAEIEAHSLTARLQVYDHMPERFHSFFESLARDWKGWDGDRVYESLEPMLKISALHNGKGMALFTVILRAGAATDFDWTASQRLSIELGRMHDVAAAAKAFAG